MIEFHEVTLRIGGRSLFEHASFNIFPGQKVGVTGANGVGKSSLFGLVTGSRQTDAGEVRLPPNWVIAHVAQETPSDARAAIEFIMDGDTELREVEREIASAEASGDGLALARAHARYEAIGGYQARAKAGRLLAGLGFAAGDGERPVDAFSGGWRMRLALGRALMGRSDLLLLDEPTNHLDLDAVLWLQEWLAGYPGTLLFVSHDRDFLDGLADHILHIENGQVILNTGNFSDFERARAQRLAQNQAAFRRQQAEIARLQGFVDRFRAKATKARQAQSRLKLLAKMEVISLAHVDSPFEFAFRPPEKLPRPLLQTEDVTVGYEGVTLLENIGLSLMPGDRVGLLGRNGAGKSTLIKLLAGLHPPSSGERRVSGELRLGYFAQHQVELLRPAENAVFHVQSLDDKASEKDIRNFLGGFGFSGERTFEPVAGFSGGEKARLVLALLVYQRPNLLLLDEPTNHLDLEMRLALIRALQDFEGAVVLVSHDSYLLRAVADDFFLVADGRVTPFDGDLDDYRAWLRNRASSNSSGAEDHRDAGTSRRETRRADAERRQRLRPLRLQLERAEAELEHCSKRREELESQLADPGLYAEEARDRLKRLLLEKAEAEASLVRAEAAWYAASEALEQAQLQTDMA
ncbi:ATP-binding cassette domain-containing protein [Methylococcus capsulatus]|uniref:Probable ATP-binding protein YheS n=1 Tax=Methylococcus capsulatus (strain ATCC 33009 / NCIMB 11132 / Bath) TaxID=243233 RepID=Q608X0_METCA|nr:ATP-binding cassette domain-containing protein [Methylococcus capsulatus]AAU92397.1 ABC transporter, ATP-binding family protein [Methylococcus capsulatus str. Bath]QXP87924.1 ATP-binding cassette domain-containing protein [Methylococcus capsulatus]QXP92335.1 ATP-binding cassette domain-containing protein [Methylococcus capsulatus]UQN12947.1 ATP-binding cassette domain-containing protein [Methylococcus capsulatus]